MVVCGGGGWLGLVEAVFVLGVVTIASAAVVFISCAGPPAFSLKHSFLSFLQLPFPVALRG